MAEGILLKVDLENKMVPQLWLQSDDSRSYEQLKKCITYKYFAKKLDFNPNHLSLHWLSDWCPHGVYIWQKLQRESISDPLATLCPLQRYGFPRTPTAKATRLQELAGRFRPRLSPEAQNRAFAKKKVSSIQILDTALTTYIKQPTMFNNPIILCSWRRGH